MPQRRGRASRIDSSADAALASIRQAVADVAAGQASAVVTNPIAKSVLYRAGFRHPGHTEFLAELAGKWRHAAAAGDDAVVARARRRARDHPSCAARGDRAAVDRPDRRDGPHRGRGSEGPFRHRAPAACGLRPQSACRRRRLARHRRDRRSSRRPSKSCAATASMPGARCRPTPCSTRRRARPTTARSACITTRR